MGRDRAKAAALALGLGGGATTGEWGTAPAGDIVVLALLHNGVVPAVTQYGDALAGKVVVDISNPFNSTFDGLAHHEETSIAQEVAKAAPAGTSAAKVFNTVFRHVLEKGRPRRVHRRRRRSGLRNRGGVRREPRGLAPAGLSAA
ncbi:hypothetical protein SVIOM342S_06006 [Streptomyces violaceorubidus]